MCTPGSPKTARCECYLYREHTSNWEDPVGCYRCQPPRLSHPPFWGLGLGLGSNGRQGRKLFRCLSLTHPYLPCPHRETRTRHKRRRHPPPICNFSSFFVSPSTKYTLASVFQLPARLSFSQTTYYTTNNQPYNNLIQNEVLRCRRCCLRGHRLRPGYLHHPRVRPSLH